VINPLRSVDDAPGDSSSLVTIAYLISQHPKVSQSFITREIDALRGAGLIVPTFAIWPAPDSETLSVADEAARAATYYLLAPTGRAGRALRGLHASSPKAIASTVRRAFRLGQGVRGKIWQFFYLVEALMLHAECASRGITHIHVHFANNAADVARLAVSLGKLSSGGITSWSFTMHGPTEFSNIRAFDLDNKAHDAKFIVAISDYARSQLLAILPVQDWPKVVVVRCGLSFDDVPVPAPRIRGSDDPLRVLCVGRLVPEKGQAILLQAIAELRGQRHACELILLGDGPEREGLEQLTQELEISDVTRFLGAVGQDEIHEWFDWADLFCLPTFAEGLPVVIMEAMASGVPVVTTRITGIPELIEHGHTGLLVPPGRPEAIAQALLDLSDRDRAAQIAKAAAKRVAELHNIDEEARKLALLFRGQLSDRSGSQGNP
jgi:colanic acid/amylovoran biosynthesis glycosyltransferase